MSTLGTVLAAEQPAHRQIGQDCDFLARELNDLFGLEFSFWSEGGELLRAGCQPWLKELDTTFGLPSGAPTFLEKSPVHLRLCIPLVSPDHHSVIAVGDFLRSCNTDPDGLISANIGRGEPVRKWREAAEIWPPDALIRTARMAQRVLQQSSFVKNLDDENQELLQRLSAVFEEINLIYGVTKNLSISTFPEELGLKALHMLQGTLSVEGTALWLKSTTQSDGPLEESSETAWITAGECPIRETDFCELVARKASGSGEPVVLNTNTDAVTPLTSIAPNVQQIVFAPVTVGSTQYGWIAGVNHIHGHELGTEEAGLIASIAALLGIHSGNRDLYLQQSEMVATVVKSLASTVDAKDPYTHGHSERVALISVMIAQELDWTAEALNTIYMAGLLHDIGKIGVNDNVLRKPGRLTDEEFDQIKKHPELGYNILKSIKQLSDILPAVLHHHENWDGTGYPYGLAGENIPEIARIMAVADAYDAMVSDRPYRNGMSVDRVEEIFRAGSGQQWDSRMIDAYFRVRHVISEVR